MTDSIPTQTVRRNRAAAVFFAASGALAILFAAPTGHRGSILLGLCDLALGAAVWLTPWHRLPPAANRVIVPVAFLMIGAFQMANAQTEATYAAFFFLTFLFAGLAYPPGSWLWLAPVAALAYATPLVLRSHPAEEIAATGVVLPLCLLMSEVVARQVRDLRSARAEAESRSAALQRESRERQEAERQARELAAIVESSEDAIVGWGLDDRITSWNAGAERLYGYSAEDAIGRPLTMIIPEPHASEVAELFERLRRGERVKAFESERRHRDGHTLTVSLTLSPIRDEEERMTGAAAIARDITEQKRLEQEVREAHQMEAIGKLAGGLAHEFNNLLTVIGGNAFLLRSDLSDDAPAATEVDEIIHATDRAGELTRQLLAFGRRQVLQPSNVDLNDVVRATQPFLREALAPAVRVEARLDPAGARAFADPGQIEQVLVALAYRARDVMASGIVTIETAAETGEGGAFAAMTVADTGPPLDAEARGRVFEPFFLADEGRRGLGLGLSIVEGIVRQSGGEIRVESDAGGNRFTVLLPRARRSSPPPEANGAGPGAGAAVLLVDDDEAVRGFTGRVLRRAGFQVLEADDGRAGLELWQARRGDISLVVADLEMPRMGGAEMSRAILDADPGARVLYISGYTEDAALRDGHGMRGAFLPKPFSPQALMDAVSRVLAAAP